MIYYIFIAVVILLYVIMGRDSIKNSSGVGLFYCILSGFLLFLIFSLRSTAVGSDTGQYARIFYHCTELSYYDIFIAHKDEPVFFLLCKLLSGIVNDHQIILVAIGALSAFSLSFIIKKYSDDYMVSYVMLFPMQYYSFMMTGLRQAMSISLILIVFSLICDKRYKAAILLFILAILCHRSALLAVPIFFISSRKISIFQYAIIIVIVPVIIVLRKPILTLGLSGFYSDYVILEQERGTYATLFLYIGILVLLLLAQKRIKQDICNKYIKLLIIGIIIQCFVPLEPNIFRVAIYYQIFTITSVPLIITYFRRYTKAPLVVDLAFIGLMIIMFSLFTFHSGDINPYSFFWENPYDSVESFM